MKKLPRLMLPSTHSPLTIKSMPPGMVEGINKRDEKCIADLYDNYSCAIFTLILKILPDKQLAEAALQKVFTKACIQISTYKNGQNVILWLANLARNEAVDILINEHSSKVFINKALSQVSGYCLPVQQFLTELDQFEKTVVALMFYRSLNCAEISEILKIPLELVNSKIKSAQRKIRSFFPARS